MTKEKGKQREEEYQSSESHTFVELTSWTSPVSVAVEYDQCCSFEHAQIIQNLVATLITG